MDTKEAFEELKRKYPKHHVEAWHWFDSNHAGCLGEKEVFRLVVGEVGVSGNDFEDCLSKLVIPDDKEIAATKRAEAAKLIEEAEKLEGVK